MTGPVVKVEGMRRLRRELKRAGVDLSDLRDVNLQAAQTVAGAVLPPRRTGRLAGSIRPGASRTAGVVRAGGARIPYAGPIHWGWPAHRIEAQPFLVDAAQRTEPTWVEQYMTELDRVLANIAGGPA